MAQVEEVGLSKAKHPPGLFILFATEMWERFGFYTMLAMFTLYLQDQAQGMGWTKAQATGLYANYLMFVYASPLIGGWLADRFLGFRWSIVIGGLAMAAGNMLLASSSKTGLTLLYAGLVFMVLGNGFFKPNISAMVGNLYPPGSPLRDSAYNIFYMGINIGAFLAPLIAEAIKQHFGFHPAFAVAGCGMVLSVLILSTFRKHLSHADVRHSAAAVSPETSDDKQEPLAVTEDLPPLLHERPAIESIPEWKRIAALLVIFTIVIVFWMGFHQNGSTFTYWANENTDWASSKVIPAIIGILTLGTVKGDQVSGVISNSINPFWIIVLSYPLVRFWGWLNRKGLEPSTPTKMALGMTLTALAFFILYTAAKMGGDTGKVSPWWLISAYFVISLGELMLSPMGLSLVSKVAPARMRGLLMGGWFVATAIGNKLTMIGEKWEDWSHSTFFLVLGLLSLGMAVVLFLLLRPLKQAMPGV